MEQILADYEESSVAFEVCDISRDAAAAAMDGIMFTPTLVRRFPSPRAWVLGDLDEPSIVRRMLDVAGATRKCLFTDLNQ
jgi:DNA-binding NarL/FixJ family response regulator